MSHSPLKVELIRNGRVLHLTLARPKANIVDAQMLAAIKTALDGNRDHNILVAVLLDAEGPNFSFGASVEEHLPQQCAAMLRTIHGVILDMLDYPVPILVAVRGHCLGGGLEVACAGSLIFAAGDSHFGQPEIRLAVFAPAASCLLPERIGSSRAEDLLFSGRSINAEEARRIGLIHMVDVAPEQAALDYIDRYLLSLSSFALRRAVRAARADFLERMRESISRVEKLYIEDLMAGRDPSEGLQAFIEKRQPEWRHQ
jgi:cyclohexa-1,5-dienecarbonyl-CoA hydratase